MKVLLLASVVLAALIRTGSGIDCYECTFTKSVPDDVEVGDPDCADPTFNIPSDDPSRVRTDCAACSKAFYYVDEDRYEVTRGCIADFENPADYDRLQLFNSCGVIFLNQGNYTNCVCDQNLCNEKINCDEKFGCWGVCPTCPPPTC